MAQYITCELCGANLDLGKVCGCMLEAESREANGRYVNNLLEYPIENMQAVSGQLGVVVPDCSAGIIRICLNTDNIDKYMLAMGYEPVSARKWKTPLNVHTYTAAKILVGAGR